MLIESLEGKVIKINDTTHSSFIIFGSFTSTRHDAMKVNIYERIFLLLKDLLVEGERDSKNINNNLWSVKASLLMIDTTHS